MIDNGNLYTVPKFAKRIGRSRQRVHYIIKHRRDNVVRFRTRAGKTVYAAIVLLKDGKVLLSEQVHIKD